MREFKVLTGDLPAGSWTVEAWDGETWFTSLSGTTVNAVEVSHDLVQLEVLDEEKVKSIGAMAGAALVGGLLLGPGGAVGGALVGGNRKKVLFICQLRDGRQFIGETDGEYWKSKFLPLTLLAAKNRQVTLDDACTGIPESGRRRFEGTCSAPNCERELGQYHTLCALHLELFMDHQGLRTEPAREQFRAQYRSTPPSTRSSHQESATNAAIGKASFQPTSPPVEAQQIPWWQRTLFGGLSLITFLGTGLGTLWAAQQSSNWNALHWIISSVLILVFGGIGLIFYFLAMPEQPGT